MNGNAYKWALTLTISCLCLISQGQTLQDTVARKFSNVLIDSFSYPERLKAGCKPVFTNAVLFVNTSGMVDSAVVADNAPEELKKAFETIKKKIDNRWLQKLVAQERLTNCGLLFPLVFIVDDDSCKIMLTESLLDLGKYNLYNGRKLNVLTYNFQPIVTTVYPTMHK